MKALVLHHAPTAKIAGQIVGSRINRPLSSFGRETSLRLAEWLRGKRDAGELTSLRRIVTSPLTRAAETAEILARSCDLEIVTDVRLKAQDFGRLDGLTFDEVRADPLLRTFLWEEIEPEARETTIPPGGESNRVFCRRALAAVDDLATDETIFILHGTVIDALIADSLGREMHEIEGANRAFEGDLLEFAGGSFSIRDRSLALVGHIAGIRQASAKDRPRIIGEYIKICERGDERIHLEKLVEHMGRYSMEALHG